MAAIESLKSDKALKMPGVYLLAYTNRPLQGERVEFRDIIYVYVGMSTTSLSMRLGQFLKGIKDGKHHNGAMRLYKYWGGKNIALQNFFVATLPLPCEPNRGLREPSDLQTMGVVTAVELFALAKIKKALQLEPH